MKGWFRLVDVKFVERAHSSHAAVELRGVTTGVTGGTSERERFRQNVGTTFATRPAYL